MNEDKSDCEDYVRGAYCDSLCDILYAGKYSPLFYFRPFRPPCQWENLRPGKFQCLIYISFITTLSGQNQYWAKMLQV